MKDKFYVFLDIDGVLNSQPFLREELKKRKLGKEITKLNPKNIDALNYLFKELSKQNNIELVISSSWRCNMPRTLQLLKEQGVNLPTLPTKSTMRDTYENSRGYEIYTYLTQVNEKNNFVIIDDEWFDFTNYFNKDNIIKTDFNGKGLTKTLVNTFLENLKSKQNQK